jgi:hypothetical protein
VAVVPLPAREPVSAPSYVVPPAVADAPRMVAPRLTNYLMHHGEFASGLTRTSVSSNVVGGAMGPLITDAPVTKPVIQEGPAIQEGLE